MFWTLGRFFDWFAMLSHVLLFLDVVSVLLKALRMVARILHVGTAVGASCCELCRDFKGI